jgi:hypothetical protein
MQTAAAGASDCRPASGASIGPLDPISGYPLVHGFAVRLPEDYRCHGPDIVALSFFATPFDQNNGGARVRSELHDAVTGNGSAPTDVALLPFWQAA